MNLFRISNIFCLDYGKVVDLLAKNGAQLNLKDSDGKTPLHLAVENSYEKIVVRLIANGADINIADASGSKPIDIATKKGLEFN